MSVFAFKALEGPLPRWMGPFSPARGIRTGFRVREDRLGTWVEDSSDLCFWKVVETRGARELMVLVQTRWGGGRVLFLPNGFVIKPLQEDSEVGRRVLIGRVTGAMRLELPGDSRFDMSDPGPLRPGDPWPGPTTTGLECVITYDGSLSCTWHHPTQYGRDDVTHTLRASDSSLAAAFRTARPGESSGRIRITANGHVITNRQEVGNRRDSVYVGWIDPKSWPDWSNWISKETE